MIDIQAGLGLFSTLILFVLMIAYVNRDLSENRKDRVFLFLILTHLILVVTNVAIGYFDGASGIIGLNYVLQIMKYFLMQMDVAIFNTYLILHIQEKTRVPNYFAYLGYYAGLFSTLLWASSIFHGEFFTIDAQGCYHEGNYAYLVFIAGAVILVFDFLVVLKYRKALGIGKALAWLSFAVLPMTLLPLTEMAGKGVAFCGVTLAILLIYVMISEEGRELAAEKELRYQRQQSSIMMSQIRPHFLFNALTSIAQLCEISPGKAKQTTIAFADYLRGNMEALTALTPISFEDELRHTKSYLYIEEMRFGEDLQIIYDIRATDFQIPLLTLQPIAENAVKHGVGQKEEGGTLIVSSKELENCYEIVVEDDGVGFDIKEYEKNSVGHVGIKNVAERLETMCGGELFIDSVPGKGTTARIRIPKEGKEL